MVPAAVSVAQPIVLAALTSLEMPPAVLAFSAPVLLLLLAVALEAVTPTLVAVPAYVAMTSSSAMAAEVPRFQVCSWALLAYLTVGHPLRLHSERCLSISVSNCPLAGP